MDRVLNIGKNTRAEVDVDLARVTHVGQIDQGGFYKVYLDSREYFTLSRVSTSGLPYMPRADFVKAWSEYLKQRDEHGLL